MLNKENSIQVAMKTEKFKRLGYQGEEGNRIVWFWALGSSKLEPKRKDSFMNCISGKDSLTKDRNAHRSHHDAMIIRVCLNRKVSVQKFQTLSFKLYDSDFEFKAFIQIFVWNLHSSWKPTDCGEENEFHLNTRRIRQIVDLTVWPAMQMLSIWRSYYTI